MKTVKFQESDHIEVYTLLIRNKCRRLVDSGAIEPTMALVISFN
jgi:hypothetical protein